MEELFSQQTEHTCFETPKYQVDKDGYIVIDDD
jgi:hypothetical protein